MSLPRAEPSPAARLPGPLATALVRSLHEHHSPEHRPSRALCEQHSCPRARLPPSRGRLGSVRLGEGSGRAPGGSPAWQRLAGLKRRQTVLETGAEAAEMFSGWCSGRSAGSVLRDHFGGPYGGWANSGNVRADAWCPARSLLPPPSCGQGLGRVKSSPSGSEGWSGDFHGNVVGRRRKSNLEISRRGLRGCAPKCVPCKDGGAESP